MSAPEQPAQATPAAERPGCLRRLVRFGVRATVVVLVVLLAVRLTLPLWLPGVVERATAGSDLDVQWGELDLRLLAGDIELRDVVVTTLDHTQGSEPLATVDYLAADLAMRDLLTGHVRLRRVSVGRAEVHLERDANGAWNLPNPAPSEEEDEEEADEPAGPADFGLPLELDRLDVAALQLTVDDALEQRFLFMEAAVEATDLGRAGEPGVLRVDVRAPGVLSDLRLEAAVDTPRVTGLAGLEGDGPRALDVTFQGRLVDLNAEAVAAWVPALGAASRELDGDVAGSLRLAATNAEGGARAELVVDQLAASALGASGVTESRLGVLRFVQTWGPGGAQLGPVRLEGLAFTVGRGASGRFRALGFEVLGSGGAARASKTANTGGARLDAEEARADASSGQPGAPDANTEQLATADASAAQPDTADSNAAQAATADASAAPPAGAGSTDTQPASAAEPSGGASTLAGAVAPLEPPAGAPPLKLAPIELVDAELRFEDELADVELVLALERLTITPRGGSGRHADLEALVRLPGVFETLELDGTLRLPKGHDDAGELRATVALGDVDPTALAPYLRAAGVGWEAGAAELDLALEARWTLGADGSLGLDAALSELAFTPRTTDAEGAAVPGQRLLGLDLMAVRGLVLAPNGDLSIDEVLIDGPLVRATREADGALYVGGLRLGAPAEEAGDQATSAATAESAAALAEAAGTVAAETVDQAVEAATGGAVTDVTEPGAGGKPLPRIQIGRLALTNTQLTLRDRTLEPPLDLAPELFEVELTGLDLFGPAASQAPFTLRLEHPELAAALDVRGAVHSQRSTPGARADRIEVELVVAGNGITTEPLTGLLAKAGIEGALTGGALDLDVRMTADLPPGETPTLGVAVDALQLTSDAGPLLAVERLRADGIRSGPDGLVLPELEVRAPELTVTRDAAGRLGIGGLVFASPPPAEPAPLERFVDPNATPAQGANPSNEAAEPPGATAAAQAAGPAIRLAGLELSGGRVVLLDTNADGDVRRHALELTASLGAVDLAAPEPTALELELRLPDAIERARLALELLPDLAAPRATGTLTLSGVRGAGLAELLPPGVEVDLADGGFAVTLDASADLRAGEAGAGTGFAVELSALELTDVDRTLLTLERLAARVPEISKDRLHVAEVVLDGLELDAGRTTDGALALPGLRLGAAPNEPPVGDAAQPADPDSTSEQTAPATPTASAPTAPWRPLIQVDTVRLELARLGWQGAGDAEPVELAFTLENTAPFTHDPYADDETRHEPLGLHLTGAAAPLLERAELTLDLAPFDPDPHFALALELAGISGPELERAVPALAQALDAGAVTAGRLSGELEGALRVRRRGPLEFDLASGVGGDFELRELFWRPTADAEPTLGITRVAGELANLDDAGMRWALLEIDRPIGAVRFTNEGIFIGKLLIPTGSAPVEAAVEEVQDQGAVAEGAPASDAAASDAAPSAAAEEVAASATDEAANEVTNEATNGARDGATSAAADVTQPVTASVPMTVSEASTRDFRVEVDELYVSGLDVLIRDDRATPPLVLPLDDLEIEVRGLASDALTSGQPISFNAYLGAGLIELPERDAAGNLVSGLFSKVSSTVSGALGSEDEDDVEQRAAWSGLDLAGRIAFEPEPTGFVALEWFGLELANFKGLVDPTGVELNDGLLDLNVDLRLLGSRGTAVSVRARAEYLSLSEPVSGPIATYLKLPAPLDSVLYLLRDENGAIVLPLDFRLSANWSPEGLLTAVSTTIGRLIGEAVASSPARFVNGVLDLAQLRSDEELELPDELFAVGFLPGSVEAGARPMLTPVEPIIALLRANPEVDVDLVHVFTDEDLKRIAALNQPDPAATRALVARLRGERDALIRARDAVAIDLRTDYALGADLERDLKHARLLDLDAEVALVEDALDELLEYLGSSGDRRAGRRARTVALMIAEQRLEAVRAALRDLAIVSIGERIRVRRARYGEQVPANVGGSVYVVPRR